MYSLFNYLEDSTHFNLLQKNVNEEKDSFILEIDMPALLSKDISVQRKGDVLTLAGKNDKRNYHHQYELSNVDYSGIKSKYESGVLKVTLPKSKADFQEIPID